MNTQTDHEHRFSASHRRALRLRLASALVAAALVAVGAAGIGTAGPASDDSLFGLQNDGALPGGTHADRRSDTGTDLG